jgi:aspartyl-tRNA(Asn)/glutamyl-tRNA(Gln) amidotransferase subunit A
MNSHITPVVEDIRSGKRTATEVVEAALKKIDDTKEYNAIIGVARERALARAKDIDEAIKTGKPVGKLAGVPFIAKDNLLTFDTKTTASSKMLEPFEAPYQATAIERLEAEGAIMVAKANLDAYAHGSSTENSVYGPTKNPHDITRVPGGSSGGSAASVALDIVPFALGTDTGGSIRLPAAFCGVVGLKPTYGSVSRYGAVAMASSTDVIGPLTHTAEDAQLILEIMGGKDDRDGTSQSIDMTPKTVDPKTLRVGIIRQHMGEGVDNDVREAVQKKIDELKADGAIIEEVDLPTLDLALAVYYVLVPAEVSSNLSRYDGVKFGHLTSESTADLEEMQSKTRAEGFMPENKRRIIIGTYVLSAGYYDAYYRKAQQARTLIINEFDAIFQKYDVLINPTSPTTAFKLGENTADPLKMYLADVMTVSMSLAGIPAVSIPVGTDAHNLPIGLQISGQQKNDALILGVARLLEEHQS